jgi:TatD DNase family protein
MIFDTHAHYDDEQFDEDRESLFASLREGGIEYVVNVGASIDTSRNTIALTEKYDFVYGAVGVHPSEAAELDDEKFEWLREATNLPKIVAVGEIGLDYYWKEPDQKIQKEWFDKQMELAKEVKLPMIIHSRDAAKDTLDMMIQANARDAGGVIHCFSYSVDMAKKYLDMGFFLGIGGVVTFNNAKKLKEVVEYAPLDMLVLETDCPYLAPVPNRGKRNSSLNLTYVVSEIARIKGIDEQEVMEVTNLNAKRLYRM